MEMNGRMPCGTSPAPLASLCLCLFVCVCGSKGFLDLQGDVGFFLLCGRTPVMFGVDSSKGK